MPAEKSDKQIIDVGQPGTTQPSPTSRPIVGGHKMMAEDPMLSVKTPGNTENAEPEAEEPEAPRVSKKVIVPISNISEEGESKEAPSKPEEAKSQDSDEPEAAAPTAEDSKEKVENPPEPAEEPDEGRSDSAVVDAVAEQADRQKKETKESEDEQKKQAAIQQLIAEKKYFVPISREVKQRSSLILILSVATLLVAAGAYLVVDAGVLGEIDLPFNLIPN